MFKIGTKVEVDSLAGSGYYCYEQMAELMELPRLKQFTDQQESIIGVVVAKSYHSSNSNLLYGIESKGEYYIYDEENLKEYSLIHKDAISQIKKLVSSKTPFYIESQSDEMSIAFQEILISLGVKWWSGSLKVDFVVSKYFVCRENPLSLEYRIHYSYDDVIEEQLEKYHPSLLSLTTGELTPQQVEYTIAELEEMVGHSIKVVK
jgi:hypothetical protein